MIAFLAAVLHKTGTWDDVQKNRPQFLQSQLTSGQNKPNKASIQIFYLDDEFRVFRIYNVFFDLL